MRTPNQINCGLIGVGTVGSAVLDFFVDGPLELRLSGAGGDGPSTVPIYLRSASRRTRHNANPKAAPEDLIKRVLRQGGEDGGSRFYHDLDPSAPGSTFKPGAPAWRRIVSDPEIDIVIEVTGSPVAEAIIQEALWNGKFVVTANKRVMSRSGYQLVRLAQARGAVLAYEGSVGGGMPIVQMMGASIGGKINAILAIVNGTTNFILTRMQAQIKMSAQPPAHPPVDPDVAAGAYPAALAAAMQEGLAEADPSDDVLGEDPRSKLIILAGLAFGVRLRPADVYMRGIARKGRLTQESIFSAADLRVLERLGYVPKLLAGAQRLATAGGERIAGWVQPVAVPLDHPLSGVGGSQNACLMQVESPVSRGMSSSGTPEGRGARGYEIMVRGPGAGGPETASSVIADIQFCAQQLAVAGRLEPGGRAAGTPVPVYMYGATALGRSQSYEGAPTAFQAESLTAPFLLRLRQRGGWSDPEMVGVIDALSDAGVEARPLPASARDAESRGDGNLYLMTAPASIRRMEGALERVLLGSDPRRVAMDVLYLPVVRRVGLEIRD